MTTDFTTEVLRRLQETGLELPASPPPPAGQYEPFRLHNGIGFLAAQTPGSTPHLRGRVGQELTFDEGRQAAEISALNALARIYEALGGFDRLITNGANLRLQYLPTTVFPLGSCRFLAFRTLFEVRFEPIGNEQTD